MTGIEWHASLYDALTLGSWDRDCEAVRSGALEASEWRLTALYGRQYLVREEQDGSSTELLLPERSDAGGMYCVRCQDGPGNTKRWIDYWQVGHGRPCPTCNEAWTDMTAAYQAGIINIPHTVRSRIYWPTGRACQEGCLEIWSGA